MPLNTAQRTYPYPVDADAIDVAGDMQRLATAIDADVERRGSEVRAYDYNATPGESADIGAVWVPISAQTLLAVEDGHHYQVTCMSTFIHRGPSDAAGATTRITLGGAVVAFGETFIPAGNMTIPWTLSATWAARGAGGSVNVGFDVTQAWWSPNPIRILRGLGYPSMIIVEDRGTLIAVP